MKPEQEREILVSHELISLHALIFKMARLGLIDYYDAEVILNKAGLFRVSGKTWKDSKESIYVLSE